MMTKLISMLLVLMMVLSLAACGNKAEEPADDAAVEDTETTEKEKWIVAINATFPPFESISESTNEYVVVDIDIANHIADKLGI